MNRWSSVTSGISLRIQSANLNTYSTLWPLFPWQVTTWNYKKENSRFSSNMILSILSWKHFGLVFWELNFPCLSKTLIKNCLGVRVVKYTRIAWQYVDHALLSWCEKRKISFSKLKKKHQRNYPVNKERLSMLLKYKVTNLFALDILQLCNFWILLCWKFLLFWFITRKRITYFCWIVTFFNNFNEKSWHFFEMTMNGHPNKALNSSLFHFLCYKRRFSVKRDRKK